MSNSFLGDMEFEQRLNELGDNQPELIRFIARQQFASSKIIVGHSKEIALLKDGDRKVSSIAGGITAVIVTIIIDIINYFISRRS